ncbi:MAG: alpha/beta hydrolase [Chitinophagaceae bacterium]|nr:alpha/beta hydrolase [Chitinophagaceae bacterium]
MSNNHKSPEKAGIRILLQLSNYWFIAIPWLIVFALLPEQGFAQLQKDHCDIRYASDTLTGHKLDIYYPGRGNPPYPVIVIIGGSGWRGNNTKNQAYFKMGIPLINSGYAVVAVNHLSSRQVKFPAQLHDIKAAVRFIRANAEVHQLDTSFIGVSGDSSGGHLAALMGTTNGISEHSEIIKSFPLEGSIGSFKMYSSKVHAVVDWFGPTDFLLMDSCGSKIVHNSADSPESNFIGAAIQVNKDLCAMANPITYIDPKDVPFLIIHGDADSSVPYCQSILLHEALKQNNVSSTMIKVPKGGHGPGIWIKPTIEKMIEFFDAQRKTGNQLKSIGPQ